MDGRSRFMVMCGVIIVGIRLAEQGLRLTYFTTDLVIGATTIGRQEKIYLVDMSDEMTWMDGYLGVDFLKSHVVYIDYRNKAVHIA